MTPTTEERQIIEELVAWATGLPLTDVSEEPKTMTGLTLKYPNSPLWNLPISDLISLSWEDLVAKYPHLS